MDRFEKQKGIAFSDLLFAREQFIISPTHICAISDQAQEGGRKASGWTS